MDKDNVPSLVACMLGCLAAGGCVAPLEVEFQSAAGAYVGSSGAGEDIVLTLQEEDKTFHGRGFVGGDPVVISGPVAWSAVGSLTRADGSSSLVRLRLSADGERLTLESEDGRAVLKRGEVTSEEAPGAFSGRFRAVESTQTVAEVSLVQSGSLVSGVALFKGRTAGVTGVVTSSSAVEGLLTFLDESQIPFQAELTPEGLLTLKVLNYSIQLSRL